MVTFIRLKASASQSKQLTHYSSRLSISTQFGFRIPLGYSCLRSLLLTDFSNSCMTRRLIHSAIIFHAIDGCYPSSLPPPITLYALPTRPLHILHHTLEKITFTVSVLNTKVNFSQKRVGYYFIRKCNSNQRFPL